MNGWLAGPIDGLDDAGVEGVGVPGDGESLVGVEVASIVGTEEGEG